MFQTIEGIKAAFAEDGLDTAAVEINEALRRDGSVVVSLRHEGHTLMEEEFEGQWSSPEPRQFLAVSEAGVFIRRAQRELWLA